MKASTALQSAISGKHIREDRASREAMNAPYEVWVEWPKDPSWPFLSKIAGIRSEVGDLFECEAVVVGGGPGCLNITYALPVIPDRDQTADEFFFSEERIDYLRYIKMSYGISRMWMRSVKSGRKISVFDREGVVEKYEQSRPWC